MIVAVSPLGTLGSGSMNPGVNLNACCRTRRGASGVDAPSALYCRWDLKRASNKKKLSYSRNPSHVLAVVRNLPQSPATAQITTVKVSPRCNKTHFSSVASSCESDAQEPQLSRWESFEQIALLGVCCNCTTPFHSLKYYD